MTSEHIRHRSDIINTQVITRDTGKRLGVVRDLLVDIDRREVVALGLRENILEIAGMPRFMFLDRIRQFGDVILVDDDTVIEDIDVDAYNRLINCQVVTETGQPLGKVRGFKFTMSDGKVESLTLAALGYPQIPEQAISTYELAIDEIISSGPDRLIVFEGAEERLNQMTVGLLERMGIGAPPWERDEEEGSYMTPATRPENQLGTGSRVVAQPLRTSAPVVQETWNDDDWSEPEPIRRKQVEPAYYYEDEEDNWSDTSQPKRAKAAYLETEPYDNSRYDDDDYYEEEDAWADTRTPEPYKPQRLNIPEKAKTPEYEEEAGY